MTRPGPSPRPLVKWAGSKRLSADRIEAAAAQDAGEGPWERWIEPFVGSGAMALAVLAHGRAKEAVLADTNVALVQFHAEVRTAPGRLVSLLETMPRAPGWEASYAEIRAQYNEAPRDTPLAAARFAWLNRAGFNGLYRENAKGLFNVPVGRYPSLSFPSLAEVEAVSAVLEGARIEAQDWRILVAEAGLGDVLYLDPPYAPRTTTANFAGYGKGGFGLAEQAALAEAAGHARDRGATVLASNHDTPWVRETWAAQRFRAIPLDVRRSISCQGATRAPVGEVLLVSTLIA